LFEDFNVCKSVKKKNVKNAKIPANLLLLHDSVAVALEEQ